MAQNCQKLYTLQLMDDKQLLEFNALGLIPGPCESENEFLKRVNYCLSLKDNLPFTCSYPTPIVGEDHPLEKTKQFFDIQPFWVPIQHNNYQLRPWHGAAAWIFQENDDLPVSAFIQVRKKMTHKKKYLGFYELSELINHELAHVGRMMFEEPKYEEMLAYKTSNSSFRRFFGSIIQSSNISMLFMLSIFLILFLDFFSIAYHPEMYDSFAYFKLIPLIMIALGCVSLYFRHRTFNKTLNNLKKIAKSPDLGQAIIYRLKDEEIDRFSKLSPQQILSHIKQEKNKSLRFRLIHLAYLSQPINSHS